MRTYYLSLGSNIGERYRWIRKGIEFLSGLGEITHCSGIYETSPVGMPEGTRNFFNCVAGLNSQTEPEKLLKKINKFEEVMGRDRSNSHMTPREIDIDILFAGDLIIRTPDLTVPHPRLTRRLFVLLPLSEIAPDFRHPVTGKTISTHLKELGSDETVQVVKAESGDRR